MMYLNARHPPITVNTVEPASPSQVFLGEIVGTRGFKGFYAQYSSCCKRSNGKDDLARGEKELEKITADHVAKVDELLKHKEVELLEV